MDIEGPFPRVVSDIEMEIREDWIAGKRYLDMNAEIEKGDKNVNSTKKVFTEKICVIRKI